jgi:predicted 2-oxoglutarate/Fe(II)-dependent dioxygenase YbiX
MFDITKLALKIPNLLTHEECDELINEFKQREEEAGLEASSNYKTNKIEVSNYRIVHLKPNTNNFNLIRSKTKEAIKIYIDYLSEPQYFFTELLKDALKYSHSYRIMEYSKGAEIHPHSDYNNGVHGSISFNLNDEYKGGEFKFFNGNHTIPLGKGDTLIFPADYFWVHEVTPVTEGTRYSLNSFICRSSYENLQKSTYLENLITRDYTENTPPEELLGPYN